MNTSLTIQRHFQLYQYALRVPVQNNRAEMQYEGDVELNGKRIARISASTTLPELDPKKYQKIADDSSASNLPFVWPTQIALIEYPDHPPDVFFYNLNRSQIGDTQMIAEALGGRSGSIIFFPLGIQNQSVFPFNADSILASALVGHLLQGISKTDLRQAWGIDFGSGLGKQLLLMKNKGLQSVVGLEKIPGVISNAKKGLLSSASNVKVLEHDFGLTRFFAEQYAQYRTEEDFDFEDFVLFCTEYTDNHANQRMIENAVRIKREETIRLIENNKITPPLLGVINLGHAFTGDNQVGLSVLKQWDTTTILAGFSDQSAQYKLESMIRKWRGGNIQKFTFPNLELFGFVSQANSA